MGISLRLLILRCITQAFSVWQKGGWGEGEMGELGELGETMRNCFQSPLTNPQLRSFPQIQFLGSRMQETPIGSWYGYVQTILLNGI